MLRQIHIICLLLFSLTLFSQNWEPFPTYSENHYLSKAENLTVRTFLADSINHRKGDSIQYFSRFNGISGQCFWKLRRDLYDSPPGFFNIDSLIFSGDSMIYSLKFFEDTYDFVFKPWVKPGESWTLTEGYSREGKCDSIRVLKVLGKTDSVKFYTLETASGSMVTFRLSKHFGLLEFIPFDLFSLGFAEGNDSEYVYELIGTGNSDQRLGFQLPEFADYFHLSAGDVLLWSYKGNGLYGEETQYYLDTLISANNSSDQADYTIKRYTFDEAGNNITTKQFDILRNSEDFQFLFETSTYYYTQEGQSTELWNCRSIRLEIEDEDTTVNASYQNDGCFIQEDNAECYMACIDVSGLEIKTFSTLSGLTYHKEFFGNELRLIGSKINGIVEGTLELPVSVSMNKIYDIEIYPNPCSDILHISSSERIHRIKILDYSGRTILESKESATLNTSDLANGSYCLRIYTFSGNIAVHKLVISR